MKKNKFVLILALLIFVTANIGHADGFTGSGRATLRQAFNITIDKALQNPGLVASMNQQLTIRILYFYMGPSLTVDVYYQKIVYRITGTREQWLEFFHSQGKHINAANNDG